MNVVVVLHFLLLLIAVVVVGSWQTQNAINGKCAL